MRKTRARAFGAAWRGLILAASLALPACGGRALLSLGGALPDDNRYLSPAGDDLNPGSETSPWKTFKHAFEELLPGQTLQLLPGTYERGTTGTLNVRCADASALSTVPDAAPAMNGTPGALITVRASKERQAFLQGDGKVPPISIDSCQNWSIQLLHVESQDFDDPQAHPDSGSVVVLDGPNENVTISKLLALHPNHNEHAQVIRIGDGAQNVTVTQCELYDFHENGIDARRSQHLVIEQNYVNARQTEDPNADTTRPADPKEGALGSIGVRLEETSVVFSLNNIVEDVDVGFAVLGRDAEAQAGALTNGSEFNVLRGNIVYQPANIGFRIDSQCNFASSCDSSHTVSETELSNDVVYRGALGVDDAGSVGTTIDKLSIIESLRGVVVAREPQNKAIPAKVMITNTLVSGFQSVGFYMDYGAGMWSISHCDSNGGYLATGPYQPDDPNRVTDKVTITPDLGACIAYIPPLSMLRTGAANDVGADVTYQYDEHGQITTAPLWMPAFSGCGAVIAPLNDGSLPSCGGVNGDGVNARLHVHSMGCP